MPDPPVRDLPNPDPCKRASAIPTGKNPTPIATPVARLFFPQSKSLGIDLGAYSPALLKKIVYAGINGCSFLQGREHLKVLAEATVPVKQVERLTQRIGAERLAQRDAEVDQWKERTLVERDQTPAGVVGPQVAVVEMDGGRLQIRTGEQTAHTQPQTDTDAANDPTTPPPPLPDNDSSPTVAPTACSALETASASSPPTAEDPPDDRRSKSKHWREDKVGCLLRVKSDVHDVDPCPEIPSVFVDPLRALTLAQQIGHCAVPEGTPFARAQPEEENDNEDESKKGKAKRPGKPEIDSRRVVASRQDVHGFGPLLAATAFSMGFFGSERRAFVADGSSENWSVHQRFFPRWIGVLDFIHALTYVYAAAMAGRPFPEGWPVYERWIGWVWQGRVESVIEELLARHQQLLLENPASVPKSPASVVGESLTYLSNQKDKMHYEEYRRKGLPLMSSHVESTIKQINYRVKGTEKFWSEGGAEAVLQLKADFLSDDEPMEAFWERRQRDATGQRTYQRAG